jgi:hypothetical protein
MGRTRIAQQTATKKAGAGRGNGISQLPRVVAAAAVGVAALCVQQFVTEGRFGWQTGAPHANISSIGKPLVSAGKLMSEHNLQAAFEVAQQHINGSGEPQIANIMTEVADGLQRRLSGGKAATRRALLSGVGGPIGDALASLTWSERPQGTPFRFQEHFEAPRLPMLLKWPREVADGEPTPELTLLSARPMVLMVDNWLSHTANASLDRVPAEYDAAKAALPQPASTPRAASPQSQGTTPWLCFNKDAPGFRDFAAVVQRCATDAMAAEAEGKPHCAATAELGRRKDGPLGAFNTPGGQGTTCGPLTKALEDALVRSDNILFDPGASDAVDTIDAAISAMLGFDFDVERLAAAAPRPIASFLKSTSATDARARAAIRDAYDFSTGPQLSRYRSMRRGGYRLHTDCHDFGLSQPTDRTHTAILYVSEPQGGGETAFPALGIQVEPRRGRLLIFEDLLSDGSCDPRTAHESTDVHLNATADKLVIQKWFYLDRAYGEHLRSNDWQEGKPRMPGTTVCFNIDCRTQDRAPGDGKTLALLKKGKNAKRGGPPLFS